MSSFLTALNLTLKHEGGYSNNPKDKGGETYQGISRNFHPDWIGWSWLDRLPAKRWSQIWEELNSFVAAFYHEHYWTRYKLDLIDSQEVANIVFDWFVNSGNEADDLQAILVSMGQEIRVDNVIGENTIKAVNSVDPAMLVANIIDTRVKYFNQGVASGWLDKSFLRGLTSRVTSYAGQAVQAVGKHPQHTGQA